MAVPSRLALIAVLGVATPCVTQTALVSQQNAGAVYVARLDAIIHPISTEYMVQTMDRADEARAGLVVFTLSTPGGLLDATRHIVSRMLAARTPIAVFVSPPGARAASAGFLLTLAADIAAMAPGTHIGAAHPVTNSGEAVDDTMKAKIESDTAAYARSLAQGRRRNVALAEEGVVSSRSFTGKEALGASPPLIDLVALDVDDLLQQINGRQVRRFDGTVTTLATSDAAVIDVQMSTRQRILSAIAHPNIAFILLSLGVLGLTIELWAPGSLVPGVVGGISLLLAFFALQLLPIDYTGVLLIALGALLLLLELKITSYGLLAIGGMTSLILGALLLSDAPEPELRLSLRFVAPVIVAGVAIAAALTRLGLAAQRLRPATGSGALIGEIGRTVTALTPGAPGQVRIRGELWRAVSADGIPKDTPIVVTAVESLTLTVRQAEVTL